MHRVVIFSKPIKQYSQIVYGKLYSGTSLTEIKNKAKNEYKNLLYMELWEKDNGPAQDFREKEGWTIGVSDEGDSTWWEYDANKYTFNTGIPGMPDQFCNEQPTPVEFVSLISGWVPIKFYDLDNDYLINRYLYESITMCPDITWESINKLEDTSDDLPF